MKVLLDTGRVLVGWGVVLGLEHLVIGLTCRDELAGAWELWPARTAAAPIFFAFASLLAIAMVGLHHLAARPKAFVAISGACGALVGWGVSGGRHLATLPLRAGFALSVAIAAMGAGYMFLRARRSLPLAPALVLLTLAAWYADAHVLPRLYPAFHAGLFGLSLALSAFAVLETAWFDGIAARVALALAVVCIITTPFSSRRLRGYDNLRRVLVEHAPWMGRAVRAATWLAPPEALAAGTFQGPTEVSRALDWSGRDIVMLSVDALRADHVGAYGYARATSPHIDALAREGTLFRHAYCPTPHTSYSVTSMMTGKYMRPLLALGLGQDSETLAGDLRRYGYRTAAFYPPAVFFIDESKFQNFAERALDFEYRKVEFADPGLREQQVSAYLSAASSPKPLFLWVHFFEPHEPYVQHPEHLFGAGDLDAYDSEIAAADDGIGRIAALVRNARPTAIVIVTADHGEEFGEHGGHYHGTTVYEEQVRVPLVVSGPGVRVGSVEAPVQTIDILPTVLSATGIPRPARVRGRDLGPLLVAPEKANEAGFAFAETDDFSMLANGSLRLVCQKQVDACSLFDVGSDAAEKHDVSSAHAADKEAMRRQVALIERSHGRYEGQGAELPDALRRGAAGDIAAAEEVAGLLDDVNVEYRRKAAAILFDLRSANVLPQLARASHKDDDATVRGTSAAALLRIDDSASHDDVKALLVARDDVARLAALALAERGDDAGESVLVDWLGTDLDFARAREIIAALARAHAKHATAMLVRLLGDVRVRAHAADALGELGDPAAKAPLLEHFATERYVGVRPHLARALLALGAKHELNPALSHFAGLQEPMQEALDIAARAELLTRATSPTNEMIATVDAPSGPLRLGVLLDAPAPLVAQIDESQAVLRGEGRERWTDIPTHGSRVSIHLTGTGLRGFWLVPAVSE